MKDIKNMKTYYDIKDNFKKQVEELESKMLKGDRKALEQYTELLEQYKDFINSYFGEKK